MKWKKWMVLAVCGLIGLASTVTAGNETERSPAAFLPEQIYTFEPVVEGSEVVHDFILYNRGNETLFIENLKSG
jgi:hypothetical protein